MSEYQIRAEIGFCEMGCGPHEPTDRSRCRESRLDARLWFPLVENVSDFALSRPCSRIYWKNWRLSS